MKVKSTRGTANKCEKATLTRQKHEELSHLGFKVDRSAQKMESRCILCHSEMNQAEVIENLPVKWSKIDGTLQATNGLKQVQYATNSFATCNKCMLQANITSP